MTTHQAFHTFSWYEKVRFFSYDQEFPILVVGACTTGLTMAAELARHGVSVRIVDKSSGIDPHCRASVIHSRTLEIFQDLGIVDEVLLNALPERGLNGYANGEQFLHTRYYPVDSPHPFGMCQMQPRTEAALERHLVRLGVKVERETELIATTPHSDRVIVSLRNEIVETPWLIGCDGAHSTVRHLNQERFPGLTDAYQYMIADVVVDGPPVSDEAYMFLGGQGDLFFFIIPEGRRLIAANLPELHDVAKEKPMLEQIQALVSERAAMDLRVSDPRWLTYFRIHYRLSPHYRHGRIFLAGDAVHIHSFIGGQGMNTGIQDAYNLAWKLALVTRGSAPESLLDSYEAERRQVAEDVIATTKLVTDRAEIFAELSAKARKKLCAKMVISDPERLRARRHTEELDLDYRQSPITIESRQQFAGGPHAGAQAIDAAPLRLNGQTMTFFELLRGPLHTLLWFAGCEHSRPSKALLDKAETAAELYHDIMRVCIVVPGSGSSFAVSAPGVTIVVDQEQALHDRYAAETECLYLIRSDGYIAHRSKALTMRDFPSYLVGTK